VANFWWWRRARIKPEWTSLWKYLSPNAVNPTP
jgi:hypothetical protein